MRRLPASALAVALVLAAGPSGSAQVSSAPPPALSPRNANYVLQATLEPETHTLRGSGRLTWRNITKAPATELRFHLYWNAWRNSGSTWMRERILAGGTALAQRPADDWGWIDLTKVTVAAGADLLPHGHFIAPDDGNANDRTVWAVGLDKAVAPGDTIDIDLAWVSHVPRTFARTGVIGNYYFIAQWFPKIGVFEDDGTWNCHQFHAATEFFADFGNYDVKIDVPEHWRVGATGRESAKHQFTQNDVHDFAWAASPDFVDAHRTFTAPGLPAVEMQLLLQPEHAAQADRHFEATSVALRDYGTWFGPYPYDHITVIDPVTIFNAAAQGESTGGMEYPTLFTAGTRFIAPWAGASPESVTIHEAGHQFWYGIVATNEFEHAWMDEGFNTFSTARAMAESQPNRFVAVERYFGGLAAWSYFDVPWSREIDGDRLNQYRPVASTEVQSRPTWQYWPATASAITYNKTALWLNTLERYLGWPTTQKILSTYFARGAFRHPTPDEFFAIASAVSGQDLTWFFDAVHRGSAVFDYGVSQVTSTPRDPRGMIGDGSSTFSAGTTAGGFDDVIIVNRLGDGVFPIDVRVTFDDGASVVERWDGRDRWHAFHYRRAGRVSTVEVDPNRVLLLDVNYTNNSWTARPHAAAAAQKWSLRWLTWLEELLITYSVFS
jgi:hypothetical protein